MQVTTSDVRGAGSDGQVLAALWGDEGRVEEFTLQQQTKEKDCGGGGSGVLFQRGATDTFTFPGPVLGCNKTLSLRLVRSLSCDLSG
jgi:hypothetical protein